MTDPDPDLPLVRVTVLGPDSTGRWHVYGYAWGRDSDAGALQVKLGTLTRAPEHGPEAVLATPTGQPEHPAPQSSVYAGARWLTNNRTQWDLSLSTIDAWRDAPGLNVDATIAGFAQRMETL